MINKQNLWIITLFSLIIVLGIYYVSLPEESTLSMVSTTTNLANVIEINEADVLIALKVEEEEKLLGEIEEANHLLLDDSSSTEQRNNAYKTIQKVNDKKRQINKIEILLKDKFKVDSCVKIDDKNISIIISGKDLGIDTVNKIINEVQNLYEEQQYITVKFQK